MATGGAGPAGVRGVVDLNDIEKTLGLTGPGGSVNPPPPTYVQQSVVRIAYVLGIAIFALTLALLAEWMWHSPAPLSNDDLKGSAKNLGENADPARKVVDNQKAFSDIYTDRSIKIFDSFIGKALLPVFTTLIGYIIGARSSKDV